MKNYYPERMELDPRDIVARANYNEIVNGRGTEHGGVWLDITHLSKEKILDRLPTMYEQFKKINGIDISKEKMEVGPTAHYSMGGVVVDIKCRTKISGLFAVGEVIGQIHGANRLGGNSLLDTVVFGKIAGGEAGRLAMEVRKKRQTGARSQPQLKVNNQDESEDGIFVVKEPAKFRNEIQELMKQNARNNKRRDKAEKWIEKNFGIEEGFLFQTQYF